MDMFDDSLREQFPAYDFTVIAKRASEIAPAERFSQAREAEKLKPVIGAILATRPHATAAAIADMLAEARTTGSDALGPTFRREVGTIVRTIKAKAKNGPVDAKPADGTTRGSRRRVAKHQNDAAAIAADVRPIATLTATGPDARSPSTRTMVPEVPLMSTGEASMPPASPEIPGTRPYQFSGSFAGKVFVHGPEIRAFFSAVDKALPPMEIARKVGPVLATPAAKAKLADLAPADRAIFDAMATWAKARGV